MKYALAAMIWIGTINVCTAQNATSNSDLFKTYNVVGPVLKKSNFAGHMLVDLGRVASCSV
jgi:hypothetical protein